MLEREILWRLMTGPLGQTVRQAGVRRHQPHVHRPRRPLDHRALDQPFRVEDLARTYGMSVSAFHRAFHAVTALSPIQFQKQIRLQQVTAAAAHAAADDVATVALPRRLRQRVPVQPRVPAPVRAPARPGRRPAARLVLGLVDARGRGRRACRRGRRDSVVRAARPRRARRRTRGRPRTARLRRTRRWRVASASLSRSARSARTRKYFVSVRTFSVLDVHPIWDERPECKMCPVERNTSSPHEPRCSAGSEEKGTVMGWKI